MKTNIIRLQEFFAVAKKYIESGIDDTKVTYAIKKLYPDKVVKIFTDYNEQREDLKAEMACTGPNGALLYQMHGTEKIYEYTPENEKKLRKALRDLVTQDVFEIKEHIVVEIPDSLTAAQIKAFNGFVINVPEPEIE